MTQTTIETTTSVPPYSVVLEDFAPEVHALTLSKGCWPTGPRTRDFKRAAITLSCKVTDIIRAYQGQEANLRTIRWVGPDQTTVGWEIFDETESFQRVAAGFKPEGFAISLAEVVLGMLDLSTALDASIMDMTNFYEIGEIHTQTRGEDRPFMDIAYDLLEYALTSDKVEDENNSRNMAILLCAGLARRYYIDLLAMVRVKHAYDKVAPTSQRRWQLWL